MLNDFFNATITIELISKLYDYYNDRKSDYSIGDLYEMWIEKLERQSNEGIIDIKTVKRDEQHWRKHVFPATKNR